MAVPKDEGSPPAASAPVSPASDTPDIDGSPASQSDVDPAVEPAGGGSEPGVGPAGGGSAGEVKVEEVKMDDEHPAGGGSEPAAAAPAGEVKMEEGKMDDEQPAGGGSEPAAAAPPEEVQKEEIEEEVEVNADGSRVRRSVENMRPYRENIIYQEEETGHFFNEQGERVDRLGRKWKARGKPGVHRSKGKYYPNWNPDGRRANPPHLHERFGPFA